MTRTRSAPPTISSTWAPAPGVHGGESRRARHAAPTSSPANGSLTGRLPHRPPRRSRCRPSAARATARSSPSRTPRANNLKDVTASIPLGTFTCITGVSGSGKSSFTIDTLYAAAARALNGARVIAGAHDGITGLEHLDKVIDIDQSPIGRTPRSNPATYTGAFTHIRDWFAGLPESRGARLQARPLQLQRQGRPLRGVPGRRPASRSRCTSCPTSMSPARYATASATTAKRWR